MIFPITYENSTVDGSDWSQERFAALDFTHEPLYPDYSYPQGCLKYVPCSLDSDPTCGHRVRSKFKVAVPTLLNGVWEWNVSRGGR